MAAGGTRTLRVVIVGNSKAAQKAIADLGGSTKKAGRDFDGFASGMTKKFAAIGAAIGASQVAKKIYDVGSSYEQNMNLIKNLDPTANIAAVNKALQDQSGALAKMGLSTVQGSEGLRELIKAGMSAKGAVASLNGTMTLATAGQLSAGDAAALVANNLNAFGLKASRAGDIANVLANAANASSADVSDLGMALSQSASVAHGAGMSFEETTAAIAALSNVGIQGSDAGTSIKTMMQSLVAPTGAGAKAMAALKLSVYDAKGQLIPFPKMLDRVSQATKGMSDKTKNANLRDIFGSDAIRAANALIPKAGKSFADLTKTVTRAGGASKAAAAQTAGFSGVLKEMKAKSESAMQGVYTAVSPTLEKVGRKALEIGPQIGGAFKKGFTGGIDPKNLGGGLLGTIARIGNAVRELVGHFKAAAGGGMGQAFIKTFQALATFGKAMLPTLQQIGGQIMAVLGPAMRDIGNLIQTKLLPAFQAFLPAITPVAKFLLKLFGSALVGLLKGLVSMIKGAINIISGVIQVFTALLTGNWSLAWEGVKNILLGVVQFIWGRIQWLWNMGIMSVFKKGFTLVTNLVKNGWTFIKNSFSGSIGAVGNLMLRLVRFITTPYRLAFQGARSFISTGWAYIRGAFSGGVGSIRAIIGRIVEVVTYPYRAAFGAAKSIVSGGWGAIRGLFSRGVSGVTGVVKALPGQIKGVFTGAIGWLKGIGSDIMNGLIQGLQNQFSSVQRMVEHVANMIPDPIKKILGIHSPSRVFAQIGEYIIAGLVGSLKGGVSRVKSVMASLSKQIMVAFAGGRITRGQKNSLLSMMNTESAKLLGAAKKREKVAAVLAASNARLAAAQKALSNLKSAKAELAGKIGESITNGLGLSDLANNDDGRGISISAILDKFRARLANATKFRDNLQALAKKGMTAGLLQQLAGMGPDTGGLVAAELLRGSSGQLAELNKLQAQTDALGANAGNFVAGTVFDGQIKSASAKVITEQRINSKLQVEIKSLDKANDQLAKLIASEVRKEIARLNRINGKKK